MQKYLLLFFLSLTMVANSQTVEPLTNQVFKFDTCVVFSRLNVDSDPKPTGLFVGKGSIKISTNTITIKYKNKEEKGKYIINYTQADFNKTDGGFFGCF